MLCRERGHRLLRSRQDSQYRRKDGVKTSGGIHALHAHGRGSRRVARPAPAHDLHAAVHPLRGGRIRRQLISSGPAVHAPRSGGEAVPRHGFLSGPMRSYLGFRTGREERTSRCPAYAGSSSSQAAHCAACRHRVPPEPGPCPRCGPDACPGLGTPSRRQELLSLLAPAGIWPACG
jgi:hypothetical protein